MSDPNEPDRRWAPSWGALSVAGLALGAAGFARCGASPAPPAPVAAAAEPKSAASVAPAPEPEPAPRTRPEPDSNAEPAAPTSPPERQAYRVAAIGDSLTDARSGGGKFLQLLRERCPESRFDNFGKGADMVNQMRRRFDRELLPAAGRWRYTHLIVFGGVNDLYSDLTAGRTPERIERDLGYMYRTARDRGMKVVAVTVAPWGGFDRYYNARRGRATLELNGWIHAQHEAGAVDHVVDAYALLSCGDSERLCPELAAPYQDGIHFGSAGHQKLGEALHRQVFASCR